jgi:hypothetical protein
MRETIEGGDVFALRVRRPRSAGLVVPFQIELNEADHLDAAKWHKLKPDLSKKQLYHLPGCDK